MRIASLLPSATEILFAIGAGTEVVGVTHECDYPPEALKLPKLTAAVGPQLSSSSEIDRHVREAMHAGSSLYSLDSELLEKLEPDLIVTQELCPVCAVSYEIVDTAARRLRSDARIVSLEPRSLQDVLGTIRFLGEVTDHLSQAEALVASLRSRIDTLELGRSSFDSAQGDTDQAPGSTDRPRGDTRTRTLVLEWTDPPMSAGHWIPELIELAGGAPLLANPGRDSQRLEWSAIAAADPDAVVVAPCGFDLPKTNRAVEELDAIEQWGALRARRNGQVLALDGNAYMSRPGPRLIDAAEIVAKWYTTSAERAG